MIITPTDIEFRSFTDRGSWDQPPPAIVGSMDTFDASATRRPLENLRDGDGFPYPILREVALIVQPVRGTRIWKAEGDSLLKDVVGRGTSAKGAIADWQKRFSSLVDRLLEMRPFETTEDDRALMSRVLSVVDLATYRASKPYQVRQVGTVLRQVSRDSGGHSRDNGGYVVVKWDDGKVEWLKAIRMDVAAVRYRSGQRFEALVTRNPSNLAVLRADAFRKLEDPQPASQEWTDRIWNRAVGGGVPQMETNEINKDFWGISE